MARAAAGLAVLAVPVGAAACGGSGRGKTATAPRVPPVVAVRHAAAKTAAAPTEHVSLTANATAAGQSVEVSATGDFVAKSASGKLHGTLSLAGTQTSVDEVVDGETVYLSSPLFSAFLPGGRRWLKLDLARASSSLGVNASALLLQNPAAVVGQLKALTAVAKVGAEQVGGVGTTHYRGRIDASKLDPGAPSAGVGLGRVDVWVGSDGYVRRLRASASSTSGGPADTTVTMTLSDFGEDVKVSPPPASETVDATNLSIPGLGG